MWRYDMERLHALLAAWVDSFHKGPVMQSFDVFFIGSQNKLLMSKWRHDVEKRFVLLTIWEGNPSVTGLFPSRRTINANVWCFVDVSSNKVLNNHSSSRWFKTPWQSYDAVVRNKGALWNWKVRWLCLGRGLKFQNIATFSMAKQNLISTWQIYQCLIHLKIEITTYIKHKSGISPIHQYLALTYQSIIRDI